VPAALAVVGACWLLLSSFVLVFPHTASGVAARQRTMAFGVGLAVVAVGWLRRGSRRVLPFVLAYAVLAIGLGLQSFVFGYGPEGRLALSWWNEKLTAALLLILCLVATVRAVRRDGQRASRPHEEAHGR
jgi:hypothetical protein